MSLFEDVLEIHYNAENRIEQPTTIEAIEQALDRVAADPEDVSVVLDWDSLDAIAHPLDAKPDVSDAFLPPEHIEQRPEIIELTLDVPVIVLGVEAGQSFGLVMVPRAARYDNSIANHDKVVAIDFAAW